MATWQWNIARLQPWFKLVHRGHGHIGIECPNWWWNSSTRPWVLILISGIVVLMCIHLYSFIYVNTDSWFIDVHSDLQTPSQRKTMKTIGPRLPLRAKPRILPLPQRCPGGACPAGRPAGALAQAPAVEQGHGPSCQALVQGESSWAQMLFVGINYSQSWVVYGIVFTTLTRKTSETFAWSCYPLVI